MQDMFFFIHHEAQGLIEPILQEYGLGLAHHRLIQFVCHYPGLTVGELQDMLGVTKQSLNRVLRDVLRLGYVHYESVPEDRRKKTLFLSQQGIKLEEMLFDLQRQQFVRAFREASTNNFIEGFQRVLYGMLNQDAKRLLECHSVRKVKGKNHHAGK